MNIVTSTISNCHLLDLTDDIFDYSYDVRCGFVIKEVQNKIVVYRKWLKEWHKSVYVPFGKYKYDNDSVTGRLAYQTFYKYCGKENIEIMKSALPKIDIWESYEQLHYYNIDYVNTKIDRDIYVFDVNSSFTSGVMSLPNSFNMLKEYMSILYNKKKNSVNQEDRSKYKNMMNYLVGYFSRIKEFVALRSEIIHNSNDIIYEKMDEIEEAGGIVFLSNTDSIVTDNIGYKIMEKYLGKEVGQFKLEQVAKKMYYKSSNAYQIGDKITYSGVGYYARINTDMYNGISAVQEGSLLKPKNKRIEDKIYKISTSNIEVTIYNDIGEIIGIKEYKLI